MRGKEQGTSLIEVLVAVAILSLVGGAFLSALGVSTGVTMATNERTMAESLAQAQLEHIMQCDYDDINSTPQYTSIELPDPNYSIEITAERLDVYGDGTENDDGSQKITVKVYHQGSLVITTEAYKVKHG
jgi:prepilin-type N-terminal cleavage/methylation domain-containing protein